MPRFSATVIDHFTNPRNCGRLNGAGDDGPVVAAFIGNPVCGDQILLTARVHDDTIAEVAFEAFGCSASLAVASILTERLAGLTVADVAAVDRDRVTDWAGGLAPDQSHVAILGADVANRLARNHREGVNDDSPVGSDG